MESYQIIWAKLRHFGREVFRDVSIWLDRLTPGQMLIGLVLFTLVLMLFMARRQRLGVRKGSPIFQFIFALAIVVFLSFGSTWIFAPDPLVQKGVELLRR